MPDQLDQHQQGHTFAQGEDAPEVEGHIRRPHTMSEGRPSDPEQSMHSHNDEDDGPDVEGHIFRH